MSDRSFWKLRTLTSVVDFARSPLELSKTSTRYYVPHRRSGTCRLELLCCLNIHPVRRSSRSDPKKGAIHFAVFFTSVEEQHSEPAQEHSHHFKYGGITVSSWIPDRDISCLVL